MKLVSIIMTCYNGEVFLKKALDSILSQTYKNWELIFIDNNSSDESSKIVLDINDHRIKYIKLDKTVNLGSVRNYAFSKCNGELITFLDVDDYWASTKLYMQVKKFESNSEIDILYTNYYQINEKKNKEIKKELFRGKCQKEILSSYVIGEPLTAWLTLMIKKRVIDRLDYPFDKSLHICSDFDLIIRLSGSCYFDFLEDYLCYYRLHPNNESKKQELEIEELSYIVTKFNNDANISNIMNLNNFSDKILIKNYINQNILEKKNIQSFKLNNKTYKFIYKLIQFIPKYFIRLFK